MYRHFGGLSAAVALGALALLGCAAGGAGHGDPRAQAQQLRGTAEHERVRQSAQSFLVAMRAGHDARACEMMTDRLQHGITFFLARNAEPGSCATRATHIYSPAKAPGHPGAHIKAIDFGGATANATVSAPGGVESDIELRKVSGTWKIANF